MSGHIPSMYELVDPAMMRMASLIKPSRPPPWMDLMGTIVRMRKKSEDRRRKDDRYLRGVYPNTLIVTTIALRRRSWRTQLEVPFYFLQHDGEFPATSSDRRGHGRRPCHGRRCRRIRPLLSRCLFSIIRRCISDVGGAFQPRRRPHRHRRCH